MFGARWRRVACFFRAGREAAGTGGAAAGTVAGAGAIGAGGGASGTGGGATTGTGAGPAVRADAATRAGVAAPPARQARCNAIATRQVTAAAAATMRCRVRLRPLVM